MVRKGTPVRMNEPAPRPAISMPQWNGSMQSRGMPVRMSEPAPVPANAQQSSWNNWGNPQRTNPINAALTTAIQNELTKLRQRQ